MDAHLNLIKNMINPDEKQTLWIVVLYWKTKPLSQAASCVTPFGRVTHTHTHSALAVLVPWLSAILARFSWNVLLDELYLHSSFPVWHEFVWSPWGSGGYFSTFTVSQGHMKLSSFHIFLAISTVRQLTLSEERPAKWVQKADLCLFHSRGHSWSTWWT